jgi:ATP-binding cassette subfamily C (CFTR/MRP) protein 1
LWSHRKVSRSNPHLSIKLTVSSGKSSLFLALLRLLDSQSGSIAIDDISLCSLPRDTVRRRLITLTQDQFILPSTVRHNTDPQGVFSDDDINRALRLVDLFDAIEEHGGLDAPFDEDVLSHGQKQLFFLARAVLRKRDGKVVLLDEVTSRQVDDQVKNLRA